MDHREIEESDVLERYVQGRLNADEALAFEAHLLDCEECFEQVRWADDMGSALRVAAAQDIARTAVQVGILARLAGAGRGRAAGWLLGLFLVAAPSALYLREHARNQQLVAPQINTPVFALGDVRDDSRTRVSLGTAPEWIVLTMPLSTVEHASYRATLLNAAGDTVWSGEDLIPDGGDQLVVSFYSPLLKPGDYDLRVTGSEADAAEKIFRFEVIG